MVIKAVFQGGECNRPDKINDTRDLDASIVNDGNNTSVITRKTECTCCPRKGSRLHKLDRLGKFLPGDANIGEDPKQC